MPYSTPETSPLVSDLMSLEGRHALVIGGAGLLGGEISHAFAELGAQVYIASRDFDKCVAFCDGINDRFGQKRAMAFKVDISDKDSIDALFSDLSDQTGGGLDILVNSGWSGRKNTFESISDEDWDNDIEICLNAVFRCCKRAMPMLAENKGNILSIASMYGHVAPDYRLYLEDGLANPPSYGAAKAGVIQLTKYMASFMAPHGIRANCISPGPFPFEETQKQIPAFIDRLGAKNPLDRIGEPHELKAAAATLCSDAGSYITGQNLCIDGGWSVW